MLLDAIFIPFVNSALSSGDICGEVEFGWGKGIRFDCVVALGDVMAKELIGEESLGVHGSGEEL